MTANELNKKDRGRRVTAYAFNVSDELLDVELASPRRRLLAVSLDMLVVAALASVDAWLLALAFLLMAIRSLWAWRFRAERRMASAAMLVVLIASALSLAAMAWLVWQSQQPSFDSQEDTVAKVVVEFSQELAPFTDESIDPPFTIDFYSLENAEGESMCIQAYCEADTALALAAQLLESSLTHAEMAAVYTNTLAHLEAQSRFNQEVDYAEFSDAAIALHRNADFKDATEVGVLAWVKSILDDLGLSFGWAAIYFSTLTAWWNGQTLGKRLLGLKVVGLDGKPLDLWGSFGRYGGYGAGLATGLLGFLQIFWDQNRQAIQDKISETVVIKC